MLLCLLRSERVEILLNAATRRNAKGDISGVVGVGQDITELNRGKAELARVANDLCRCAMSNSQPALVTPSLPVATPASSSPLTLPGRC
jgi:hypothetical protein